MNDRFKFRFWNEKEKTYFMPCIERAFTSNGEFVGIYDYCDFHGFIAEQCTEKKDRNGKLIFEGDIIKIGTISAPVIWNGGWFLKFGDFLEPFWHFNFINHSIVGNIHENPELLK